MEGVLRLKVANAWLHWRQR